MASSPTESGGGLSSNSSQPSPNKNVERNVNNGDSVCSRSDDEERHTAVTNLFTTLINERRNGRKKKSRKGGKRRQESESESDDEWIMERDRLLVENVGLETDIFELDWELTRLQGRACEILRQVDFLCSSNGNIQRDRHRRFVGLVRLNSRKLQEIIRSSCLTVRRIRQTIQDRRFGHDLDALRCVGGTQRRRSSSEREQRQPSFQYFTLSEVEHASDTRSEASQSPSSRASSSGFILVPGSCTQTK